MLKSLRPLFPYLKRYRRGLTFGALSVILTNVIYVQFPQVVQSATNDLNAYGANRLSSRVLAHNLVIDALLLVAVFLAKGVFQFLTRWIVIGISRDIEFDLRNDLFRHLEQLPHSYYQRMRVGDIMARATNDLSAVRNLLGPAIMYSATTLVFTVFALSYMWHTSPRLTLYAFAPLPVISIVIQHFGRKIHERFERIQASFSDISARAQENFSGVRIVRAFAQEEAEIAHFEKSNKEYIRRALLLVRLMGMLWPSLRFFLGLAVVLVLWLGGREVILGHIDLGQFVAFTTYMVMLTFPVIALGWVINIFQRGTASMLRLQEIFETKPDIPTSAFAGGNGQPHEIEISGGIEFRGLNFSYGSTQVLHNVDLSIPAGTSLAIVGPTGSGKSTLVSLIPRIYDAAPGAVLIDGRPIQDIPVNELRRNIGFVPQETFLFSDTIRENIAFGAVGATDDEIYAAADGASIARDIDSFPDRFLTLVGERGITLSGGQKQRTAIARALIRNPRILVLDDALASVDTYTEEKILDHLREVMRGRTTIFISHRVSTVKNADRIAVLHDGRVVEYGTHDELLSLNGYYTDLYNKQLLEEELETV